MAHLVLDRLTKSALFGAATLVNWDFNAGVAAEKNKTLTAESNSTANDPSGHQGAIASASTAVYTGGEEGGTGSSYGGNNMAGGQTLDRDKYLGGQMLAGRDYGDARLAWDLDQAATLARLATDNVTVTITAGPTTRVYQKSFGLWTLSASIYRGQGLEIGPGGIQSVTTVSDSLALEAAARVTFRGKQFQIGSGAEVSESQSMVLGQSPMQPSLKTGAAVKVTAFDTSAKAKVAIAPGQDSATASLSISNSVTGDGTQVQVSVSGGLTAVGANAVYNGYRDIQQGRQQLEALSGMASAVGSMAIAAFHAMDGETATEQDIQHAQELRGRAGAYGFVQPIILDLDANGVQITQLDQSSRFFDTNDDGYKEQTAWAGIGDAVLAFDAQNDSKIDQKNEIVFTEWDPTAKSDMQALRDVFDTNGNGWLDNGEDANKNGKLDAGEDLNGNGVLDTAGDGQFSKFKLVVTNNDGTSSVVTLASENITAIKLIENEVEITLPDGSTITGQTTYQKSDGSTETAATVSLATDDQGYATSSTTTTSGGFKTIDKAIRNPDGSLASNIRVKTDLTSLVQTTRFDDDGDSVWDRVQTMDPTTAGTVTITNTTNAGVLIDVTQTKSSSGTVTISRNQNGLDYFDQVETQVTGVDGNVSITIVDQDSKADAIDTTTKTTKVDAVSGEILSRDEKIDWNADATIDWRETDDTVINVDKSRTDTVIDYSGTTKTSSTITITSADGQTKSITADLDGDTKVDVSSVDEISSSTKSGTTTSTTHLTNTARDGTTVVMDSLVVQTVTGPNIHTETQLDRDGIDSYDLKTVDDTTVSGSVRTQTIQDFSADGTLLDSKQTIRHDDDGQSRSVETDADGDGHDDQTEVISLDGSSKSTDTLTNLAADGSVVSQQITTASSSGLSVTSLSDSDGDGLFETKVTDVTVVTSGASTTETVETRNSDGSLRGSDAVTTTADGLKITTATDVDGDSLVDLTTNDFTVVDDKNPAAYQVRTVSHLNQDSSLRDKAVTTTSQNKRSITVKTDLDGDSAVDPTDAAFDRVETIAIGDYGDIADSVANYAPGHVLAYQTTVTTSANKLSKTTTEDWNGDATPDLITTDNTVLNSDGSRTETISNTNPAAAIFNRTKIVTSANGLTKTTTLDLNGDGTTDITSVDATALNDDGSRTETVERSNSAGLVDQSETVTSGNGLTVTTNVDADGDNVFESSSVALTEFDADGSTIGTVTVTNGDATARSKTVTVTSAHKDAVTVTRSLNGKKVQTETTARQEDGDVVDTILTLNAATAAVVSRIVTTTSANGLKSSTLTVDALGVQLDKVTAATVLNSDGSRTTTLQEDGAVDASIVTTRSDNGLQIDTQTKLTGTTTSYAADTSDLTEIEAYGETLQTVSVKSSSGSLLDRGVRTTSDDNLVTAFEVDRNGDGTTDIAASSKTDVDGSTADTIALYADDGKLLDARSAAVSADGRTSTVMRDADGNGAFERSVTSVRNADDSVTTTIVSDGAFGATAVRQVVVDSIDNDGSTISTQSHYSVDGALLDVTIDRVSANGLTKTTLFDTDGDGDVDLTRSDVTKLNADGSKVETETFETAGQALMSKTVRTTSADGLTTSMDVDSDGNGFNEFTLTVQKALDASSVTTQTLYDNRAGDIELDEQFTTTVSVGGLITKASSKGYTDSTYDYAGGNGSYEWVRKVGSTVAGASSHSIDANGIDTWTWSIPSGTTWGTTTGDKVASYSGSIQIDSKTEQQYVDFAQRVYETTLDREMSSDEMEMLGGYVKNGDLDRDLIATNIMATDEWSDRWWTANMVSTDTKFVDQMYANSFGHMPSDEVRDFYVQQLGSGNMDRAAVVVALAEGAADGQITRNDIHTKTGSPSGDYSNAAAGVTVNLVSWINDGEARDDMHYAAMVTLIGTDFDDELVGGSYDNVLIGGRGADELWGNAYNDTISYATSSGGVTANLATGKGSGSDAAGDTYGYVENLVGSAFSDTLTGDTGANELTGGALNDYLDGGSGNDTALYERSSAAVTVNLKTGVGAGGDAEGDKLVSIENLVGSDFNDILTGTTGVNVIVGGRGNDLMTGDAGNDTYIVDSSGDEVVEVSGGGTDLVESSADNYTLDVQVENLTLTGIWNINGTGNSLVNVITGNIGDNVLDGGDEGGSPQNDKLVGDNGNDTYLLRNSGDAVTEVSAEGTDTIEIDFSSATYTMASNTEVLRLGAGVTGVTITGTTGGVRMYGNDSDGNKLIGGTWNDFLFSGSGKDDLQGGGGTDVVSYEYSTKAVTANLQIGTGSSGDADGDKYTAIAGLIGGSGNDDLTAKNTTGSTLDGGIGADKLHGGSGSDTFIVDNAKDEVTDTAGGTDLVQSWAETYALGVDQDIETLTLMGHEDIDGTGNNRANTINGNDGNNIIDGGLGTAPDTLVGGKGDDVLVVRDTNDITKENAGEGTDTIEAWASYDIQENASSNVIENMILMGSAGLTGTGNWLDNTLTGNSGNNVLDGYTGNDILVGGAGTDTLNGNTGTDYASYVTSTAGLTINTASTSLSTGDAQNDTYTAIEGIVGSNYNDTITASGTITHIDGGQGNDKLYGSSGNDTFVVDSAIDEVYDTAGGAADLVQSWAMSYALIAGQAIETLTLMGTDDIGGTGNELANKINGNDGNNRLDDGGSAAIDTLVGGKGNDTYLVHNTGAVTTESSGQGTDTVEAWVSYTLGNASTNYVENLTLMDSTNINGTGNWLDNVIIGNAGNNVLDGDPAGWSSNDTLIGGAGNDTLIGDGGTDTASYATASKGVTADLGNSANNTKDDDAKGDTYSGIENLTGSGYADSLTGDKNANVLDGGLGDDTLEGGLGNDTFIVDSAADVVTDAGGTDTVQSTAASYTLGTSNGVENLTLVGETNSSGTGNELANIITGNDGANVLDGGVGAGIDKLYGNDGDDILVIRHSTDVATELTGEGNDTVQAWASYTIGNFIENLTMMGSANLNGTGNSLNNIIIGNSGNDALDGGSGYDNLHGGTGDDTLTGGTGDDVLEGGTGADSLNGGTGLWDDTASYNDSAAGVTVDLSIGSAQTSAGDAAGDTLVNIDDLIGSAYADQLTGDANANEIQGGLGNDTIKGAAGNDRLEGGEGDDVLEGGAGSDIINGGNGSDWASYKSSSTAVTVSLTTETGTGGDVAGDTLHDIENLIGSDGADTLTGDAGDNVLRGGIGADTLDGQAGLDTADYSEDTVALTVDLNTSAQTSGGTASGDILSGIENVSGGSGNDTLTGDGNANRLVGGAGNDNLTGNAGNDYLDGGSGADKLKGGLGSDTYIVDNAADVITEAFGEGTDTVISSVARSLEANLEKLTLTGTGNNAGTGNALNNTIIGNGGNNALKGNDGNDTITGGAGNDTITGGDGTDIAVFSGDLATYSINTTGGTTTVVDNDKAANGDDGTDTITSVESLKFRDGDHNLSAPIVLDLDNNGILLTNRGSNGASIDLDGDGIGDKTGWIGSGDGLLIIDRNGDGTYTDASELSFIDDKPGAKSDLDGLSAFDTNGDGMLSAADQELSKFLVWQDADGNGTVGEGEIRTLSQAGVQSIDLAGTATEQTWNWQQGLILNTGTFVWSDGSKGNLADVAFIYDGSASPASPNQPDDPTGTGDSTYFVGDDDSVDIEDTDGGTDLVESSGNYTLGNGLENLTLTGSSNATGTGTNEANVIVGNAGDNLIQGAGGDDDLAGGAGNDLLVGGNGTDIYRFEVGGGQDSINASSSDDTHDVLKIGSGVEADQLWFSRTSDDGLQINVIGTTDSILVQGWYQSSANQLGEIGLGGGVYASAGGVDALVSAMAAFDPPPLGQMVLDPTRATALAPTLAASWHSS